LALTVCALFAGVMSASAWGDDYGQLARFPISPGSYKITEFTDAFGVDSSDANEVYVGEEAPEKKEEASGEYQIQSYSAAGAPGAKTVTFIPKRADGLEGVAVDAATETIYVLAVYERNTGTEEKLDPEEPAAGTLYAFNAKTLESAVAGAGQEEKEGVLATSTTLKAASNKQGDALIHPSGIVFDSTTNEVLIGGEVDEGTTKGWHTAIQGVTTAGALGKRYVDPTVETTREEANSLVVSQAGVVYVQAYAPTGPQIVKIPANLEAKAPTLAFRFNFTESNLGPLEELVEFDPSEEAITKGAGMALLAGSGNDGTIYTDAEVKEQVLVDGNLEPEAGYPGALVLNYAESGLTEHGWTGGRNEQLGTKSECEIAEGGETYPMVAAGSGEKLFVFAPDTLEVVELGTGGGGCPHTSVPAITASVDGQPSGEPVAPGTEVTLSSPVVDGNVSSVEWNFGDGSKAEVKNYDAEQVTQLPEITHKYTKEEDVTITEKIKTDDLASPEVMVERKLLISRPLPTAKLRGPSAPVSVGQAVKLEGEAAPPKGSTITEYHWNFGDGSVATTKTEAKEASIEHAYAKPGTYTAALTVTNSEGLTSSAATVSITVSEPGGGGGGTTTTPTTTTPTTTTTTTTETPKQGVLTYKASLASSSVTVSASGTLALKVDCSGQSSCRGTVTLRTLDAVSASNGKKKKKAVLTLASGSFSVAGGHMGTVTLRLSAAGRKLLASSHNTLRVRVTILGRDSTGATHQMQATITLHAAKPRSHKR
jgi:PKD repeat protein